MCSVFRQIGFISRKLECMYLTQHFGLGVHSKATTTNTPSFWQVYSSSTGKWWKFPQLSQTTHFNSVCGVGGLGGVGRQFLPQKLVVGQLVGVREAKSRARCIP